MDVEIIEPPTVKYDKINKVLKKFLEPNFKVKNDVYLNLFSTHLVRKIEENQTSIINTHKDQLNQWLIEATTLWTKTQNVPPSTIMSFALNLTSQLSIEEEIFVKLNSQNIFETLVGIAQKNLKDDASIILGTVTLLCSFLEHKSGLQWVLATNYWTDLVKLGREAHTMYIRKKAYEFTAKLLEKTLIFNNNFCLNLVTMLVKPLKDAYQDLPSAESNLPTLIDNSVLFESLKPSLIFISEVLELLVSNMQGSILNLFVEQETLEITTKLLLVSNIEALSYELLKIRIVLLFTTICPKKQTKNGNHAVANFDYLTIFHSIKDEMRKNHVRCVIKIGHFAQTVYCNLAEKSPLCIRKGVPIEFQNQMFLFQLVPILVFLSQRRDTLEDTVHEVFRREFYQNFFKMSSWHVMSYCLTWKEKLLEKSTLIDDLIFGLQYMIKTKKMLNKERAILFFQPLVYCLKDVLHLVTINQPQGVASDSNRYSKFVQTIMETIIDLVQSFDLTWKDSIEAICILSIACEFLHYNHWAEKTVVTALKLLNLSMAKYMSSEMVLLMVKTEDSVVDKAGNLLYTKCHDSSWEVRDTALENVLTLSANAISMFPSYTKIIIDSGFPYLVFQMALNDGEYYVRSTGFRCLQEMIQIQDVWDKLLDSGQFLEKVLNVLENETEGVVRKEAALLIHKINIHQNFPEEMLPRLYDVMTHAAVGDLHWEVKCHAVDFWFSVFEKYLTEQGMIDYTFPNFTFSKEKKKIVKLTELEVRKRLITVLNQLSKIGCLYALKCACLDDCDVEVSRQACARVRKLVVLMKMYKVPSDNIDQISNPASVSTESGICQSPPDSAKSSSTSSSDVHVISDSEEANSPLDPSKIDSILDDLLNSNDMSFLKEIYNPSDQIPLSQIQMKKSTYFSPSEFCRFIYNELEKHSMDKTQWLHSLHEFDSLLDDILKEYNVLEVNDMDCY